MTLNKRATSALCLLGLVLGALSTAAPVVAPAAAISTTAATLEVPGSPTADVVVRATADPTAAPYLQVLLIRSPLSLDRHREAAIDPAPVVNTGAPVEVSVPTWGLSGVDATFVLLACASADPGTCATELAAETRHVVQTAPAAAEVSAPDDPVFVPEEQVVVATSNDGGGVMAAYFYGGRPTTLEAIEGTAALTRFPELSSPHRLRVGRCSELALVTYNCEFWLAEESMSVVSDIDVVMLGGWRPTVTLDPRWHASRFKVSVASNVGQPQRVAWSLLDANGVEVVGPVTLPLSTSAVNDVWFDPGEHADHALPDGEYTARFEVIVTKGDLVRTGVVERFVEVVNDPPADRPAVHAPQRVWRPTSGSGRVTPRFTVYAFPGDARPYGELLMRNQRGRVVERRSVPNPCHPTCAQGTTWDVDFDALGVVVPRAALYRAELVMPDSYGRTVVTDLGTVDVQRLEGVRRSVRFPATVALVHRNGDRRVYQVRLPWLRNSHHVHVLAGLRIVDGPPRGAVRTRMPDLGRRWSTSRTLGHGAGWRLVRVGSWHGLDAERPLFRSLQIEVTGPPRRSAVSHVMALVRAEVWRSSRT